MHRSIITLLLVLPIFSIFIETHASLTDTDPAFFQMINPTAPFQTIHQTTMDTGNISIKHDYHVGEFGFRLYPLDKTKKTKHLIVSGDSNVFGVGVSELHTPAYLMASELKDYAPYNFGIRGGGPNNTLALMEYFPWEKIVNESQGLFIINHYEYLIDRVIGSKNYIQWSHGNAPWYELENDQVVFKGFFIESLLVKIYQYINRYDWLDRLLPVLPRYRYGHTELLAKIYLRIKNIYLSKFPKGKFIVAINYTFSDVTSERLKDLEIELTKNNIKYIVLPRIINLKTDRLLDGHLNKLGHEKEAYQMFRKLKEII